MPSSSRLTPAVHQRVCDSIEAGNSERVAAESAEIGSRTLERYLARGRDADMLVVGYAGENVGAVDALGEAEPDRDAHDDVLIVLAGVAERERPYWRLYRDVGRARARNAEREMAFITEAAAGYESVETRTETRDVIDKDGNVVALTTTVTIRRYVRDWRAGAWKLEHSPGLKDDYAKAAVRQPIELTGAGGGPIAVEGAETTDEAVAQLRTRALRIVRPSPPEDGQVEDTA